MQFMDQIRQDIRKSTLYLVCMELKVYDFSFQCYCLATRDTSMSTASYSTTLIHLKERTDCMKCD